MDKMKDKIHVDPFIAKGNKKTQRQQRSQKVCQLNSILGIRAHFWLCATIHQNMHFVYMYCIYILEMPWTSIEN